MGTAGLNLAKFSDVDTDELIARARTVNDTAVRKDLYSQFQQKWEELAPSLVLLYPKYLYIYHDSLVGPVPGVLVTPAQRFYNIQAWHD
jgi:peptide/nickel transport system substrate-binding protein